MSTPSEVEAIFSAPRTSKPRRVTEDTPRPIREIIPEVPEWLCDLVARLHAKDPAERFASAREVADRLAGLAAGSEPPPSIRPSSMADTVRFRVRRPILRERAWVAAAAVLVMGFGSLCFTVATGVTHVRGTVIRLLSPEGTLVDEVDDPEVGVKVDGSDIEITGTGAKNIRLKPGQYTVEARKNGKLVSQELGNGTRNGRPVVRINREGPPEGTKVAEATADASAWEATVAAMPAIPRVKAVASRLKELNPGFDGAVRPTVEDGMVTGLELSAEHVSDLSPVRVLVKLTSLDCSGRFGSIGRLIDLSPLGGLSLTRLRCACTNV